MSKILITPASGKIEFITGSNRVTMEPDNTGNLQFKDQAGDELAEMSRTQGFKIKKGGIRLGNNEIFNSSGSYKAFDNGTATVPALRGSDGDTGIYFTPNTSLHVSVNGSESLVIASNEVSASATSTGSFGQGSFNHIVLDNGQKLFTYRSSPANYFNYYNWSMNTIYTGNITNSGAGGFKINAGAGKLSLATDTFVTGSLTVSSTLNTKGTGINIYRSNGAGPSVISMEGNFIRNAASGYAHVWKENGTQTMRLYGGDFSVNSDTNITGSLTVSGSDAKFGVGVSSSLYPFHVQHEFQELSGNQYGGWIFSDINPPSNSSGVFTGLRPTVETRPGNDINYTGVLIGMAPRVFHYGTGSVNDMRGINLVARNKAGGTVTTGTAAIMNIVNDDEGSISTAYGGRFQVSQYNATGSIGTAHAGYFELSANAGTIDQFYGLYVGATSTGTHTNSSYNLYISDTGSLNYLGGNTSVSGTLNVGNDVTVSANDTETSPNLLISQASTGDATIGFTIDGGNSWIAGINNSDGDKFLISPNITDVGSSPSFAINSSGDVGIGTSFPSQQLEVRGNVTISGSATTTLRIESSDTSSPATTAQITMHGYEGRAKGIFYYDRDDTKEWFCGIPYNSGHDIFQIGRGGTNNAEYAASASFTIDVSDNVNIPRGNLTVVGDVTATTIGGITEANLVDKSANETITGDWTFNGNIIVGGTTTTVNSTTVEIGDNIIVLNSDEAGTPSQDAGIEIERGTSANKQFLWDEGSDYWVTDDDLHVTGNVTLTGTVDGRDVATDGSKLDGIAAGAATGTVTSVGTTGTVNGITLTGTVTTSGNLTLGGTLAVNNSDWSGTDLAVANGGTGASDASTARTNLGVAIGSDVQAYHATLAAVAGSTYSGDNAITTLGTIGTGVWQGTAIASAYLDSDTAHLSTTQTFSGVKTFSAPVTASAGLYVSSSVGGANVFKVEGTSGSLFEVNDSFDGILMSVNDIGGVPIMAVSSSGMFSVNKPNMVYECDVIGTGSFTGGAIMGDRSVVGSDTLNATYEFYTVGDIGATGDVVAYVSSDSRLKDNIQVIPDALTKVSKLRGVTWDWNDLATDAARETPGLGVIAQEVEEVFPELVVNRDTGYKAVDYERLVGVLIEAIKELKAEVNELKYNQ